MQTPEQKKAWEKANPKRGRSYEDMGIQIENPWKRTQGSLEQAAADDPVMRRKIAKGRREADRDRWAFDNWASSGFNSGGGIDDDE